ncbi:MAG: ATPase [Mycobacterium sp.]
MSADECFIVTRTVAATPAEIFAVLSNPARHPDTEPGDWVRGAVTTEQITAAGQIFVMNMYLEQMGGDYVIVNLVTDFEPDRTIEWKPGRLDDKGRHEAAGWSWRYDLRGRGGATDVTLTYDWSATPQRVRDGFSRMPPFGPEFIERSLSTLAATAETTTRA